MRHLSGVLLATLLLLSIPARGIDLDTSLVPVCLALASDPADKSLQQKLANHPHVRLIKQELPSHADVSFVQMKEQKERLTYYSSGLLNYKASLPSYAADATEFLGAGALSEGLTIRIVCGQPYDGFGFSKNGKTHLFVNLALIRPDFFPHLLRHEIWHAAFHQKFPRMAQAHGKSEAPLKQLGYIMLNEGVGHYYSFRRRVEPKIAYDNWQERTDVIFSLLQKNAESLKTTDSIDEVSELLWSSEAGVPFWQKWGATAGAIITYRLKNKLGATALKRIIAKGPCGFLQTYQKEALQLPDWQNIPQSLVDANCAVD